LTDLQLREMAVSKLKKEEPMLLVASPKDHINSKMELSILDSGLVDSEMVKVAKFGPMVQDMRVPGPTTKQMAMVN